MNKNTKRILFGAGIITAIVLLWKNRKKRTVGLTASIGGGQGNVQIGTTLEGEPVIAAVNTGSSSMPTIKPGEPVMGLGSGAGGPAPKNDAFASNLQDNSSAIKTGFMSAAGGGGTWVCGGYNAQQGGTYVWPEGNMGAGVFIPGHVYMASGTRFTPSNYVLSLQQ